MKRSLEVKRCVAKRDINDRPVRNVVRSYSFRNFCVQVRDLQRYTGALLLKRSLHDDTLTRAEPFPEHVQG